MPHKYKHCNTRLAPSLAHSTHLRGNRQFFFVFGILIFYHAQNFLPDTTDFSVQSLYVFKISCHNSVLFFCVDKFSTYLFVNENAIVVIVIIRNFDRFFYRQTSKFRCPEIYRNLSC